MFKSRWRRGADGALTNERLRILLICIAVQIGLVVAWHFAPEIVLPQYAPDFTALWTAARAGGEVAYDAPALTALQAPLMPFTGLRPFPYPPTLLALLAPFARLPFWPAMALWTAVGAGLFLLALRRVLKPWELALVALSPGVLYAAFSGQTTLLLGAGVVWATLRLDTRPRLAGAVLGLVAAIKPQLVLVAPLALLAQPAALLPFFGAGAAACGAALALYGPHLWIAWLQALPGFSRIVADTPFILSRNLSPAGGMIAAGFGPDWLIRLAWGALGVTLTAVTFRRRLEPESRLAALALGSFLCSPYVMPYDAALLAPAAVMMLRRPYAPAILVFLMLPYFPWLCTAASAVLAACLLVDALRHRPAAAKAPEIAGAEPA